MHLKDKIAVVTGGASGIGTALCRRFAKEGARGIVVADINAEDAAKVAEEVGGLAVTADVGVEQDVIRIVDETVFDVRHLVSVAWPRLGHYCESVLPGDLGDPNRNNRQRMP